MNALCTILSFVCMAGAIVRLHDGLYTRAAFAFIGAAAWIFLAVNV